MRVVIPATAPHEEVANATFFREQLGQPTKIKISPDEFSPGRNPFIEVKFKDGSVRFSNLGWAYGGIRHPEHGHSSTGSSLDAALNVLEIMGLSMHPRDLPLVSEQLGNDIVFVDEEPHFYKHNGQIYIPITHQNLAKWERIKSREYDSEHDD